MSLLPALPRVRAAALALGVLVAADAGAIPLGPFPLVDPSSIASQDQSIVVQPTGSISLDVPTVPLAAPQAFSLTDVAIQAGPLSFALDPTLASPALGVLQPDGRFLIPTLFLVGSDGANAFDLALTNVRGVLIGAPDEVLGLFTQFQVDDGTNVFDVALYANVPEPGTALLLTLGCVALAARRAKETTR